MIAAVKTALIEMMQDAGLANVKGHWPVMSDGTLLKDEAQRTLPDGSVMLSLWLVERVTADLLDDGGNLEDWTHTLRLSGWRTCANAASQAAFDAEVDTVLGLFWPETTLHGAVERISAARLVDARPVLFYNMLCHYARIEIRVEVTP